MSQKHFAYRFSGRLAANAELAIITNTTNDFISTLSLLTCSQYKYNLIWNWMSRIGITNICWICSLMPDWQSENEIKENAYLNTISQTELNSNYSMPIRTEWDRCPQIATLFFELYKHTISCKLSTNKSRILCLCPNILAI